MAKIFVEVTARFHPNGSIQPLDIRWQDGRRFEVDRVLEVRRAAALKAGGCGLRFLCRILGRERYLFLEKGRWFVEGRGVCSLPE